jgi:hypothetical protein
VSGDTEHPIEGWSLLPPAEIVATIDLAPVPQIPYASLRHALVPVRDPAGRLVDWEVAASTLDDPEVVAAYWDWRRRWKQQWPIGPVSNVAALVRATELMGHPLGVELGDLLPRLSATQAQDVHWAPGDDDAACAEIEALRVALVDTVEVGPGAGIVDHTPGPGRGHGLSRSWVMDDVEQVLAASSITTVLVRPDEGLVVRYTGGVPVTVTWVSDVDLLSEPAVVVSDDGTRLELSPEAARPLAWLVPRALVWKVITVPVVLVWAQLLTNLPEAIRAARAIDSRVCFTTAAPVR